MVTFEKTAKEMPHFDFVLTEPLLVLGIEPRLP